MSDQSPYSSDGGEGRYYAEERIVRDGVQNLNMNRNSNSEYAQSISDFPDEESSSNFDAKFNRFPRDAFTESMGSERMSRSDDPRRSTVVPPLSAGAVRQGSYAFSNRSAASSSAAASRPYSAPVTVKPGKSPKEPSTSPGGDGETKVMKPTSSSRSPSPSAHAKIMANPNYKDRITLDLTGLDLTASKDLPQDRLVSLEQIPDDPIDIPLISSPRSVEACLRQGISPAELVVRTVDEFEEGVPRAIARVRFEHYEARRKEKLFLLREERLRIIEEELQEEQTAMQDSQADSTMLENERRRMERKLRQNRAHMMQMLEYERKLQEKARESNARIQAQKDAEKMEKEMAAMEAHRREEERIRRQQEHKEATERILKEQQDLVARKQEQLLAKEAERQKHLEEQRKMLAEANEEQRIRMMAKLQAAQEQAQRNLEDQRRIFFEKQELVEERRREFEEYRREMQEEHRRRAEEKSEKIARTIQRNQEMEEERIQMALRKQHEADVRKMRFDEMRDVLTKQKQDLDRQKEMQRREAFEHARSEAQARANFFRTKAEQADENLRRAKERRKYEAMMKLEEARLRQQDKLENVERMKRIQEFQKIKTLEAIEAKRAKIVYMKEQKKAMLDQRKRNQEYLDKQKMVFEKSGPGPGAYIDLKKTGEDVPAWRFGVSHELQKKRVLSREHAKEWYGVWGPGPGAYDVGKGPNKAPKFGFSRQERFKQPTGQTVTPGPAAYSPTSKFAANPNKTEETKARSRSLARIRSASTTR